jgi:hypothetical protein
VRWTVVALLMILFASDARAGDGVLEINQTCAVQTGCFAGDTAGFPVTISSSGSYRLTGNLTVPNENTHGLVVGGASGVSIDLAGFEIRGPVTCSGVPVVCSPATGSGSGIERTSSAVHGISVRNGSITGMGANGVILGSQAEVTKLRVRWNGLDGISVFQGSIVSGSTVFENGGDGILGFHGSTFSANAVFNNGGDGIHVWDGSTVSGNTSYVNGQDGIDAKSGSTITGNTTYGNKAYGINGGQSTVIQGNTIRVNSTGGITAGFLAHVIDNSLDGNDGPGIAASDGSNISRNTVGAITPIFAGHPGITCGGGCAVYDNLVRNTSQAMTLGAGSRYSRNVLSLSPNPAVTGSGVSAGDNLCDGVSC